MFRKRLAAIAVALLVAVGLVATAQPANAHPESRYYNQYCGVASATGSIQVTESWFVYPSEWHTHSAVSSAPGENNTRIRNHTTGRLTVKVRTMRDGIVMYDSGFFVVNAGSEINLPIVTAAQTGITYPSNSNPRTVVTYFRTDQTNAPHDYQITRWKHPSFGGGVECAWTQGADY